MSSTSRTFPALAAALLFWASPGAVLKAQSADTPPQIFQAFCRAWDANEQQQATQEANRLVALGEQALPLMPQLIEKLRVMPAEASVQSTTFSFYEDLNRIFGGIGGAAAEPLVDLIAEGEARVTRVSPRSPDDTFGDIGPVSRYDNIARAFHYLSFEGIQAAPNLIEKLNYTSPEVRAVSARCLAAMGPLAAKALPRLRELCNDPDAGCRERALEACAFIDLDTTSLCPLLSKGLHDENKKVQEQALRIVIALGKNAAPVRQDLLELLKSADLGPVSVKLPMTEDTYPAFLADLPACHLLQAICAVGMDNNKECDLIADVWSRPSSQVAACAQSILAETLSNSGAVAHATLRKIFHATSGADLPRQLAVIKAAMRAKPLDSEIFPEVMKRFVDLYTHTPYAKYPRHPLKDDSFAWEEKYHPTEWDKELYRISFRWPYAINVPATAFPQWVENKNPIGENLVLYCLQLQPVTQREALLPLKDWLIGRLEQPREKQDVSIVVKALGQIGPAAAAAVPKLREMANAFDQTRDTGKDAFAVLMALASITGDDAHWVHLAEQKVRLPTQAGGNKDGEIQLGDFLSALDALGDSALPLYLRWLNSADERAAKFTESHLQDTQNSTLAAGMLPILLARHSQDSTANKIDWVCRMAQVAGPKGGAALPVLIDYLDQDMSNSEAKAGSAPFAPLADHALAKVVKALRAIGVQGGASIAIPALLRVYENEAIPDEGFESWRVLVIETLVLLGHNNKLHTDRHVLRLTTKIVTGTASYEVQEKALAELAAFGPLAHAAVPGLLRAARLQSWSPQTSWIKTLSAISGTDPKAAAFLHTWKMENPPEVRQHDLL